MRGLSRRWAHVWADLLNRGFCLQRIGRDERGNVLLLFGLLAIPLIGAVGLAIDSARAYAVRSQIQQALDAGALAGGRLFALSDAERDATIRSYFSENLAQTRYGATTDVFDPAHLQIAADKIAGQLTVSADAVMPVTVMGVLGFSTVPVAASAQIIRKNTSLELALVLDMSGSMTEGVSCSWCAPKKIDSLKTAAKMLVDILYPDGVGTMVQTSIVPWNSQVFIGPLYAGWLTTSPPPTGWPGTVYMRLAGDKDLIDDPPSSAPFLASTKVSSTIKRVLPLTSDRAGLKSYIDSLSAGGTTTSSVGLFWGWMTISPRWQGLWSGVSADLPRAYDAEDNIKAVVLMTDGINNYVSYSYKPPPQPDGTYASQVWINNRSLAICSELKSRGVRIYTIGFGPEPLTDSLSISLLKGCASGGNFFPAANSAQLIAAFKAIATDLSALRLSH